MVFNCSILSLHASRLTGLSPLFALQRESSFTLSKARFTRVFPLIFKISKISQHKLLIKQSQFSQVSNGVVHINSLGQCTNDYTPEVDEEVIIEDNSFINCSGGVGKSIFYTGENPGESGASLLIKSSFFQNIISTANASVAHLESCKVNITDTTFVNCSGEEAGIALFINCKEVHLSNINATNCQANGTNEEFSDDFMFVRCMIDITGFTVSNPNATTNNTLISIIDGHFSSIKNGFFQPQENSACLKYTNSMNNELYSIGFANITKEPITVSASTLVAKHMCKSNETVNYAKDTNNGIIILSDINFTNYCEYEDVKIPTTPPATKISKSEKTAAIVTLTFFLIFFVAVFVTLISLVFCKVGLSEELTFSGTQSFEEDSFESFAN